MSRAVVFGIAFVSGIVSTGLSYGAAGDVSAQTRQKLDQPLPPSVLIDFSKGVTLRDALDFLRDVSGANFHVNWKAIEAAGVPADTQVTFRLRNVSLRKALTMVVAEAGGDENKLAFYVDEGIVEVTSKDIADSIQYTIVYPVEDLMVRSPEEDPQLMMSSMQGVSLGIGGGGGGGGRGGGRRGGGGYGGGGYGGGGYGGGRRGGGGGYGGGGYGGGYGGGGYGGGSGGGGFGGGFGGGMGMMGMGMGMGGMGGATADGKAKQAGDDLVELIKATVFPKYWEDGKASIKFYKGNLVITAPRIIHEAIGGPID